MKNKKDILNLLNNKTPIWGYSPRGISDPTLSIRISQIGGVGLVDLEGLNSNQCQKLLEKLYSSLSTDFIWGIRIPTPEVLNKLKFHNSIPIIICAFSPNSQNLKKLHENSKLLLSEVHYLEEAYDTADWADLFLVKGNEAGGMVSTKSSFILTQEFRKAGLPFIIQGGFGVYNISSAFIGGALGVILESQLYLFPECPLSPEFKEYIKTIEEYDFHLIMETFRYNYRLIGKIANKPIRKIKEIEMKDLLKFNEVKNNNYGTLKHKLYQEVAKLEQEYCIFSDPNPKHSWLPSDHGICFAKYFLAKFTNLENFLLNITKIIQHQFENIKEHWPFTKNSEFARKLNITYPIIQGPMANISDHLAFAEKIANDGALPILALGGLLANETTELLSAAAKNNFSDKPYGCGIIGLEVMKSRREEHLRSISKYGPKITLVAAGTISLGVQVKNLGNTVLIHTPALSMFKDALKKNLPFTILEGRECGGHIGILSSFILWECILEYLDMHRKELTEKVNIVFAGGIINEISTAMLAVMIGNHLDVINPGIQMGTAYLLSEEMVNTHALSPIYQEILLNNSSTTIIGTTVNTRARVIPSTFTYQTINQELSRKAQGIPISKRKESYEKDNLGALRIASKAEIWNDNHIEGSGTTQFIPISNEKQLTDGVFMTGDCISLQKTLRNITQIHYDITDGGWKFIKSISNHIFKESSKIIHKVENNQLKKVIPLENRVAIIGLGGVFPDATNIGQFWNNIINKKYSITEVPNERWDPAIFYSEDHTIPEKTYTKIGGFVKNFEFKSIKYRIPPNMAERMDPVQKWTIVAAKEALIDAGYPINGKEQLNIAVIIGNSLGGENQRYSNKRIILNEINYRINEVCSQGLINQDQKEKLVEYLRKTMVSHIPKINEDTMPGELSNIIAGRVSNVFNLTGKNMTTDAACASSLAALDTAVKGILVKDYNVALVGGADRSMDPSCYIKFCKIGALSGEGSYPFDARANGFVMGEGAGFIVIKRLEDAIHDNNKIYAVISGLGASSDGKGKGITAPNPNGQRWAIERAFTTSHTKPTDIQYLECHGTSTIRGDATELEVMNDFFSSRNSNKKLAIGSVKSQIGHLKSAAGIASVIKTALSLYHKVIPPSVNFITPNPIINWNTSPFYVNTEPKEWISPQDGIRKAGVSSFGFGGSNYHTILEEYFPQSYSDFSLKSTKNAVQNQFQEIAHTSNVLSTDLCFLFSGQGSQYVGMAKELYQKYQVIQNTLDKANEICKNFGGFDLLEIIFGSPDLTKEENSHKLTQTEYTQPAIYSVEMALMNLFNSENINPNIVGGHSLGEFTALTTAGVLNFEDALKAVIVRGKAMAELPPGIQCTMAAIFTSSDVVKTILNDISIEDVSISNFNSTTQTVISGEISAIDKALKIFTEKGIKAIKLNVSNAFHSKFVAHAEEKLKKFLKSIEFKTPKIPVFSNVTGKVYPEDPDKIKTILIKQITSPVRWVDEILHIYQHGGRRFVEIGPKKALFFFTKDILKQYKEIEVDYTLSPKTSEEQQIQKILKKFENLKSFDNTYPNQSIDSPSQLQKANTSTKSSKSVILHDVFNSNNELIELSRNPYFNDFLKEEKELLSSILIHGFRKYVEKYRPALDHQKDMEKLKFNFAPIGITGVGIGLPGKKRKVFDDKNIEDILQGINLIEPVDNESQELFLQKQIIRLEKSPNGNAKFVPIDDINKVIHLAGQLGEFNPTEDFQLNSKLLNALDTTYQLAICAGYEALKDAGIPLIRNNIITSTGKVLSGDWVLPEDLQEDTGILFASAFPGLDNFAEDISAHLESDFRNKTQQKIYSFYTQLLESLSNKKLREELEQWFDKNKHQLSVSEDGIKNFNRAFLFRVLSMGHSQFAQLIKAKGPNTCTNAACASTTQAIGIAEDWIRNGRCKRVIIITADNVTKKSLFQWIGAGFIASGAGTIKSRWEEAVLPFGVGRNGIICGAGACAFVIELMPSAQVRGVKPIVEILGSYFGNSAYHGSRLDKTHISQELDKFVLEMEKRHGISKYELVTQGLFVSHETYSPARGGSAEAELEALEKVFGEDAYKMLIINTKGYTGHAMATGIEEAVAIKSMEKGLIPPIANLKKIDPKYKRFNFSKGLKERKQYALRFAAGFGSQLGIVLLRLESFENRFSNPQYEQWLKKIGGNRSQFFMEGRILKMNVQKILTKSDTSKSALISKPLQVQLEEISLGTSSIKDSIIQIISLKTGYDPGDIEDNYDLEEDLGIDTVKQAEIFGEIREKWKLEEDDSFNLADYRTINDIVFMLNKLKKEQSDSSLESTNTISYKDKIDKDILSNDINQVEDKVKRIIAEKTGYELEDIDTEFDLEEDLGIDTVKQAEIFGEVREYWQIPENADIDLMELQKVKNIIQKINIYLNSQNTTENENSTQLNSIKQMHFESGNIEQVQDFVKKVISEKTGYEIEDIDTEFDLEEDLGVDTVKQAEIFGEIRDYYNLDDSIDYNITELRTPGEIANFLSQLQIEKPKLSEENLVHSKKDMKLIEKSDEKKEEKIFISQIIPCQVSRLLKSKSISKFKNSDALLLNINLGLSNYQNLNEEFDKIGLTIQNFNISNEKNFIQKLENTINEYPLNKKFKNIFIIVPDNSQYSINESLALFDNIFIIFQKIDLSTIEKILVISPESYFGWENSANPLSAGIGAFIKTINKEFQIPLKHIYSKNPKQILQEFLIWDDLEEIAYKESSRYTLLRKKVSITSEMENLAITADDVLLSIGGARGITFACIDELTDKVQPKLILLGRTSIDNSLSECLNYTPEMLEEKKKELIDSLKSKQERVTPVVMKKEWKKFLNKLEILRNIQSLEKKGLSVQYYAVDVTNDENMQKAMQQIQKNLEKPISIVIHGAGIEESKSFLKKKLNMAHKIVEVKIKGVSNILKHLHLQDLKLFVLFSSIAGRYGNQGQIDYAFANGYLSRLAWNSTHHDIPFLAIDWSAWADVGMATEGSILQVITQAGIDPVPLKTGVEIFTKLVLNNCTGEYLVAGNLGLFEKKPNLEEAIERNKHPMLTKISYQSDLIIASHTLNTKFDAYLLDHQIQQKPVFPGVMVLETFAEFYNQVFNKSMSTISNVVFQSPLKIPENKSVDIELKYSKSTDEITLYSRTYPSVLKGKPLIKEHFSAKFNNSIKKEKWNNFSLFEPLIPILNKNEIYELFFHGEKFQVLKEIIQLEKGKIIAKVDIPTTPLINYETKENEKDPFQLNPLAFECVFQTVGLFDVIINDLFSLPSKITSLEILSKQTPKYIISEFIKKDKEHSYYNALILSENQEIIARINNLAMIHTPISVNLSKKLTDYLLTLQEYYLLKNMNLSSDFQIVLIEKLNYILQKEPKFLEIYLTENEIDNSKRFRNDKRKLEYFAGIFAAKTCYLAHSLDIKSYQDIEIQKDEKGKPFYFSNVKKQKIPMNLSISHSHDFAIAIINKNEIGIDLERIESRSPSFYKEVFTESERKIISEDAKLGTIYWTAKEAFSKAIGKGFHINFRDIELNYQEKKKEFSINLKNNLLNINKKLKNLSLKSKFTKKYVLSWCEIK